MSGKDLNARQTKPGGKKREPARPVTTEPTILPEDEIELSDSLQRAAVDPSKLKSQDILMLQEALGNRLVSNLLSHPDASPGVIQRHPPGANLLPGAAAAEQDVKNAQQGQAAAETGATPAAKPSKAPETPAIPEAGKEEGKAAEGGQKAQTGPGPTPVLTGTMDIAFAQKAIQDSFKQVAPKAIITGQITVVNGEAELYKVYDELCVKDNVINKDTGKTWEMGDKKKYNDAHGLRTNAFAYGEKVWVDATGEDPTATVHEMLHVNTAKDFLTKTGRIINEGMTQHLAVKAVQATGSSVVGSEFTYQDEQHVVSLIMDIVGEDKLTHAYFNGADELIEAYNAKKGEDAFKDLKEEIDNENYGDIIELLLGKGDAAKAKIDEIDDLLTGWVTDENLADIQKIFDSASDKEKKSIRMVIDPMTYGLFWRERTREKVREIIGTKVKG